MHPKLLYFHPFTPPILLLSNPLRTGWNVPEAYRPGFTLVDAPDAIQKDLVQELVHDALRRHAGKVLVYDSSHAFHPDSYAATNRRKGRPEAEFAERCLIQRCITPFQWDTLLSKHLDKFLTANPGNVALIVAFPYGRLFATDELADWERVDHLDFSLDHLAKRGAQVPIVAVTSLDAIADQPELHRRLGGVQDLVRVRRHKGVWQLPPSGPTAELAENAETDGAPRVPRVPRLGGGAGNIHLALSKPQVPGWDGLHPMGMSQPTVSNQIDAFQASFSAFRANLPKREQARFDDLVTWARRHGNALNVSEDLDVTRRILLVAAIALTDRTVTLAQRDDALAARHDALAAQVEARLRALEARAGLPSPVLPAKEPDHADVPASPDAGFVPLRRVSQRNLELHGGVGQVADGHVPAEGPVPA
jgi:hypothetical protein